MHTVIHTHTHTHTTNYMAPFLDRFQLNQGFRAFTGMRTEFTFNPIYITDTHIHTKTGE